MQLMHVDSVLDGFVAELVGSSVRVSGFDAAPGHPHREAERVVVTVAGVAALTKSKPSDPPCSSCGSGALMATHCFEP